MTLLLAYAILDFMIKKIIATPQLEFMYLITDFESFIEFAWIHNFLCTCDEKTALGYEIPWLLCYLHYLKDFYNNIIPKTIIKSKIYKVSKSSFQIQCLGHSWPRKVRRSPRWLLHPRPVRYYHVWRYLPCNLQKCSQLA